MRKIFILLFLSFSFAYSQSAENIFSKIQQGFSEIKSMSADYSSGVNMLGNPEVISKGKFYYKKEKMIRVEFPGMIILSDGKNFWNFNERQNRVIIQSLEENNSILDLTKLLFEYPKDCYISLGDNEKYINSVELVSKSKIDFDRIFVGADEGYQIKYIKIIDSSENEYSFKFSSVKINLILKKDLFIFTKPEGVKVIDFR